MKRADDCLTPSLTREHADEPMPARFNIPAARAGGLLTTANIAEVSPTGGVRRMLAVRLAARRRHRGRRRLDVSGGHWPKGSQVHAVVVTDGRMGYCRFEQRATIAEIRAEEAREVVCDPRPAAGAVCTSRLSRRQPERLPRPALYHTAMPTEIEGAGGHAERLYDAVAAGAAQRGSFCPPVPICTPTTASSTKKC